MPTSTETASSRNLVARAEDGPDPCPSLLISDSVNPAPAAPGAAPRPSGVAVAAEPPPLGSVAPAPAPAAPGAAPRPSGVAVAAEPPPLGSVAPAPAPAAPGAASRPSGVSVETVPKRGKRRSFSAAEKLRIVRQAAACTKRGEVEALLRREGIYSSHLTAWRKQLVLHGSEALAGAQARSQAQAGR